MQDGAAAEEGLMKEQYSASRPEAAQKQGAGRSHPFTAGRVGRGFCLQATAILSSILSSALPWMGCLTPIEPGAWNIYISPQSCINL